MTPMSLYPQANTVSDETVRLVRLAQASAQRSITSQSGLVGYLLEVPAKAIVPIITPLRNMIPRKAGRGAPSVNWKAITSFDTNRTLGVVSEGNVPSAVTYNVTNMNNLFATIALSNAVTFQAQWRGRMLEGDVRARRTAELLYQLMTREEFWIINASQKILTPPAPLVTTATTGGTVAAGTYWVQVTAMTLAALNAGSTEGLPSPMAAASTSAFGVVTTTGTTSTITVQIFTVPNAYQYRVYIGSGATPPANAAMYLQALQSNANAPQPAYNAAVSLASGNSATSGENAGPTVTPAVITAPPVTGTANPPTALTGANGYTSTDSVTGAINMWDGLISQALNNTTNNGTLASVVARPAATNGVFVLNDIDALLLNMYSSNAGDPDILICNPIDSARITNLQVLAGQTRYMVEANSPAQANLVANYRTTHYINKTTGKAIPIIEDRYCPVGCLLFVPLRMPFPVADVSNAIEIETNQEYWGVDFAVTASQFQFADYVESSLKVYFLGGLGMLWGCIPSA